jgi:histidinol-phosphate aminotransferase
MNVNPYGPSPRVVEVIRANLELVNQYPDTEYGPLVERIADFHRVKPTQITLGCGSREVLRMAVASFLSPRKSFVLASPTYQPMAGMAKQVGAKVAAVPVGKRYAHDLDGMLRRAKASTGLVYICNPNNPTGTLTPRKDLEAFLEKLPSKAAVLIDEAYHEYVPPRSDYASFIDHPIDDKRVIVIRTFSKIHGLAGLRLGYAVSSEEMSPKLSSTQLSKGVNKLAARAAVAALDDSDYVRQSARRNANDRQEFYNATNVRMLAQIESLTNFVFVRTGLPSSDVFAHFQRNGITLGPVVPEVDKYVRVAISTQANMYEFWRVWDLMPSMPHEMGFNLME